MQTTEIENEIETSIMAKTGHSEEKLGNCQKSKETRRMTCFPCFHILDCTQTLCTCLYFEIVYACLTHPSTTKLKGKWGIVSGLCTDVILC